MAFFTLSNWTMNLQFENGKKGIASQIQIPSQIHIQIQIETLTYWRDKKSPPGWADEAGFCPVLCCIRRISLFEICIIICLKYTFLFGRNCFSNVSDRHCQHGWVSLDYTCESQIFTSPTRQSRPGHFKRNKGQGTLESKLDFICIHDLSVFGLPTITIVIYVCFFMTMYLHHL